MGNFSKGIDISHYQGQIQWQTIAQQNLDFVFVKLTEGNNIVDQYALPNWAGAKSAGLIRGVYHFLHPEEDAKSQADYFIQHLKAIDYGLNDLPPVLDVEMANASADKVQHATLTWLTAVEQAFGRKPIVYTGPSYYTQYLAPIAKTLSQYPLWLAEYGVPNPKTPAAWKQWSFWQYGTGTVKGIQGAVDCNTFNGTLDALETMFAVKKKGVVPATAPVAHS